MSYDIDNMRTTIQNLIDLKGEDIELIGPDIIESLGHIETHILALDDEIDDLKREVNDLQDGDDNRLGNEPEHTIKTDNGEMQVWYGNASIDEVRVIDALNVCYEKGFTSNKIANILEATAK